MQEKNNEQARQAVQLLAVLRDTPRTRILLQIMADTRPQYNGRRSVDIRRFIDGHATQRGLSLTLTEAQALRDALAAADLTELPQDQTAGQMETGAGE